MKKESLKSYLCELLQIKQGDISDDSLTSLNTEIKQYRKFLKELKIKERNIAGDKIYKALHDENKTLVNSVAKKRGKEALCDDLKKIYIAQKKYYEDTLKPKYEEECVKTCRRIADADIMIKEFEYENTICVDREDINSEYSWEEFLKDVDRDWLKINEYIDRIFNLAFSNYYEDDSYELRKTNVNNLNEIINDEIKYYEKVKEIYKDCKSRETNSNPYKNLYVYYCNSYILDFYHIDLPDTKDYLGFKNFVLPFTKEKYTLCDVAKIYKSMTQINTQVEKIYERIKKMFQKLKYMQKFKEGREYKFGDISLPLAAYSYYKTKNNKVSEDLFLTDNIDLLIADRYAPLLNCLIKKENEKITAYTTYKDFLLYEYNDLFSTLSTCYQDSMKSFLIDSPERIYYRLFGLTYDKVYNPFGNIL